MPLIGSCPWLLTLFRSFRNLGFRGGSLGVGFQEISRALLSAQALCFLDSVMREAAAPPWVSSLQPSCYPHHCGPHLVTPELHSDGAFPPLRCSGRPQQCRSIIKRKIIMETWDPGEDICHKPHYSVLCVRKVPHPIMLSERSRIGRV